MKGQHGRRRGFQREKKRSCSYPIFHEQFSDQDSFPRNQIRVTRHNLARAKSRFSCSFSYLGQTWPSLRTVFPRTSNPIRDTKLGVSQVCAPGRIRTCGLRFRKPSLYPLSYGGGIRLCRIRVSFSLLVSRKNFCTEGRISPRTRDENVNESNLFSTSLPGAQILFEKNLGSADPLGSSTAGRPTARY